MRNTALVLALLASGCGSKASDAPVQAAPAPAAHLIRTMQLSETETSRIGFESAHARGTIEIRPGVRIGYASAASNGVTRQSLTLDGKAFVFDGPELLIGPQSYGPLAGEVAIVIEPGLVRVNGQKRGEL
jgi:hypothetical protein